MGAITFLERDENMSYLFDYTMELEIMSELAPKPSHLSCHSSAGTPDGTQRIKMEATVGKTIPSVKAAIPSTKTTPTSAECAAWKSKKCSKQDCVCKCALSDLLA